ncbi:MAG: LPS export ABC transporter periplasmic protein LptC [Chitinophagales bacterium]|nr:LPS export ABC transporter periplasmic protein LptC [Chitinophagales bacterium]
MSKYLLAGILLIFVFSACKNDLEEIEALMENFDTRIEIAKDVEILYSDSAIVRVRITGPTMHNHISKREPKQEFPDGMYVEFFDGSGKITSHLSARYGLRMQKKDEVVVRDSVVWESIEGEKLETEELIWEERKKRVYTNKFVVVTRPDEIIYGHGFEADQDFTYSRINAIEGRLKVNEPTDQSPEQ